MNIERAVSYAIFNTGNQVLAVKRPDKDPHLPSIWGLPAGTILKGESVEESLRRSGFEKLGIVIEPIHFIGRGHKSRPESLLLMETYQAKVIQGRPCVGQNYPKVTQYEAHKWMHPTDLLPAVKKGSLCTKVFLDNYSSVYNNPHEPSLDTKRDPA